MTSKESGKNDALSKVAELTISAEKQESNKNSKQGGDVQKQQDLRKDLDGSEKVPKATEQSIDPWSVEAATDEQGNTLEFDYVQISKYVECSESL